LGELNKLMEALGVKTCLLVHHTTKDGEEYFGTVAFQASLSAMIRFEVKGDDKTTVTVSCMRMREGEAFEPFDIKLQKVTVKTRPDKWGRTEQEMLAVIPGAEAAALQPDTLDKDMTLMATVLRTFGPLTSGQFRDQMHAITTTKNKDGWSKATFNRRLKDFKERTPNLKGDGLQGGEPYSLGAQPAGATVEVLRELGEAVSSLTPNRSQAQSLRETETSETGFGEVSSSLKAVSETSETGSSQDRAEWDSVVDTEEDLARKALDHLEPVVKLAGGGTE
jgi:hypothetical protein